MSDGNLRLEISADVTHELLAKPQRFDIVVEADPAAIEALVEDLASRVSLWDVIKKRLGR